MNKKIFAAFGLLLISGIVIFINVDTRTTEQQRLDAIAWFIYSQTGEFDNYEALYFLEITNEMLLEDLQLRTQIAVVADTLNQKVTLLEHFDKLPESWHHEIAQFNQLQPDQIDEWMQFKVKIDLPLIALDDHRVQPILEKETAALDLIEAKLHALNLSIHSIDLSGEKSIHYLHRFALDGKEAFSVFEIDANTDEVISYKEIG